MATQIVRVVLAPNGLIQTYLNDQRQPAMNGGVVGIGVYTDVINTNINDSNFTARGVIVDNETPIGFLFPDQNLYVPPFCSGAVKRIPENEVARDIHIQGRFSPTSWQIPSGGLTAIIKYVDYTPATDQSGTTYSTSITVFPSSLYGSVPTTTGDASSQPAVALETAQGYDYGMSPTSGRLVLKRTPNTWIQAGLNQTLSGGVAPLYTYTAPNGMWWRLMYLDVSVDTGGVVLPAGVAQFYIGDSGAQRTGFLALARDAGQYMAFKTMNLPENGMESVANNGLLTSTFVINSFLPWAASTTWRILAGLYVGN